jgi:stage III sporulation protein AA
LTVSGRNISLRISVGEDEVKETFKRVCGGAVFAHRDDICSGYVTLDSGIRVGICGHARYEAGKIVGVGKISALVFRIPSTECPFAEKLFREWQAHPGGMLICSPAGVGKTTAIRSLAGYIGSGKDPKRVVVVDERCEFDVCKYAHAHVDVLRGYKRTLGVDIAIRTLSAQVIIVDEIGSMEDSLALLGALGAGVEVIATAHADGIESAMKRDYIRTLVSGRLFGSVCTIVKGQNGYSFSVVPIDDKTVKY